MKTALLVIDVQNIYTDKSSEMYSKDSTRTVERINNIIKAFKDAEEPVFLVRHVHKRDGSDLGRMFDFGDEPEEDFNFKDGESEVEFDPRLQRPVDAIELTKTRYSAFVGTSLKKLLADRGIERVVVCGFMTNFCCESTARQAHDLDFHVDFVVDATGTPGTENLSERDLRKTVAETVAAGIGRVLTTKQFIRQYAAAGQ